MINLLLMLAINAVCFAAGWQARSRRARLREVALAEQLRKHQQDQQQLAVLLAARMAEHQKLVRMVSVIAVDNQRMADWCGRFRDLYLDAIHLIDPRLSDELRVKWAQVQTPEVVNRLLQRVKHG